MNVGNCSQFSPSLKEAATLAEMVDSSIAGGTRYRYKRAWSFWGKFLEEKHRRLAWNPTLVLMGPSEKAQLLALFAHWCARKKAAGDKIPAVKTLMQGLNFEFTRRGREDTAFESKLLKRAMRGLRPNARTRSKTYAKNVKLPGGYEMIQKAAEMFCDDVDTKGAWRHRLQLGKSFRYPGVDCFMTGLGVEFSYVHFSRASEFCHTKKALGGDEEDMHAVRNEDIVFTLQEENRVTLYQAHEVPGRTKPEQVAEINCTLNSDKMNQDGTKTRTTTITSGSERGKAHMKRMLTWALRKGPGKAEEMFFSRRITDKGKLKRLTNGMINAAWKLTAKAMGLPPSRFSSKSGKIGAISALNAGGEGGAGSRPSPSASFHASSRSQGHYRFREPQQAGTSAVLNDDTVDVSLERLKALARSLAASNAGTGDNRTSFEIGGHKKSA